MTQQSTAPEFSQEVWAQAAPLLDSIRCHPFLTGLADGSLDRRVFTHYLAQDALYLAQYGRALAAAAAQAHEPDEIVFWTDSARNSILVERELHETYVADLNAAEPSPTCVAYTNHLLAQAAGGDLPVLVAALVPCFWIYRDVGEWLLKVAGDLEQHPYGPWVRTYADPSFAQEATQAIMIMDRHAARAGEWTRDHMRATFARSARYEWMFWDAAQRLETWPL